MTHHRKLMKDTLTLGDEKVPDQDDDVGEQHDGEDGPQPIGAMGRDVLERNTIWRVCTSDKNTSDDRSPSVLEKQYWTHCELAWIASLPLRELSEDMMVDENMKYAVAMGRREGERWDIKSYKSRWRRDPVIFLCLTLA